MARAHPPERRLSFLLHPAHFADDASPLARCADASILRDLFQSSSGPRVRRPRARLHVRFVRAKVASEPAGTAAAAASITETIATSTFATAAAASVAGAAAVSQPARQGLARAPIWPQLLG